MVNVWGIDRRWRPSGKRRDTGSTSCVDWPPGVSDNRGRCQVISLWMIVLITWIAGSGGGGGYLDGRDGTGALLHKIALHTYMWNDVLECYFEISDTCMYKDKVFVNRYSMK